MIKISDADMGRYKVLDNVTSFSNTSERVTRLVGCYQEDHAASHSLNSAELVQKHQYLLGFINSVFLAENRHHKEDRFRPWAIGTR